MARPDWGALLKDHEFEFDEQEPATPKVEDGTFKRFVRGRLFWYAMTAVVLAAFIYLAV